MEGGLSQKGKIFQQDVFSCCIQRRLKLLNAILVLKAHNTRTNQLPSFIASGCLSQSCCPGSS